MSDTEDYLNSYRKFFEHFAETVNPEDQLPVRVAGYNITESELPGEILLWSTQYLTEKECPKTLLTPLLRIILEEVLSTSKKQPADYGFRSEDSVYISLRLMQAVAAKVNDVCLRYLDNAKLDTLPSPQDCPKVYKTSTAAIKNSRRQMEDRHVEIGNLEELFGIETTEPTSFYAVYDGHGGSAAAVYCAAHLHQYLVESSSFKTDLKRALKEAYMRTDAEFVRKSEQEFCKSVCGGSTAVVICVRGSKLYASWAGDSQALLAKDMGLMQLVKPHKPNRLDEKERIEALGGAVFESCSTWRVNGQLAVSRAIGDAQYKPYVTAKPEMCTIDLDGNEDFVTVACDGLWDYLSEDQVALSTYMQISANPDDVTSVSKNIVSQAKKAQSPDNITVITVFLKDPKQIARDNAPMEFGLENALGSAPPAPVPFSMEGEPCKRQVDAAPSPVEDMDMDNGNGVDNSDSESEDLGPETAVDVDDVIDAEVHIAVPDAVINNVERNHLDGALLDNVAESGEESEDEWDYIKGGKAQEETPIEEPNSETPCQDNSAWESSSADMNSSPLNPDAPAFVPTIAGGDILLAESPRKPQPMDDIEVPDAAQFENEAVVRPAELLDLDNCDQLNGHHNISFNDSLKEHLNGNDASTMDSIGYGVNIDSEKMIATNLIEDFTRIQKDTTDMCNIEVFRAQAESNPFAMESNDELLERLKNKERDPMSMSFYQEKDDDTCEKFNANETEVDLNAVQPLPESDDEEPMQNGGYDDKENVCPQEYSKMDNAPLETNFDTDANATNEFTTDASSHQLDFEAHTAQDPVPQTETPESHKLLFEQIPEIPDGKSSDLGFVDEAQSESETGEHAHQEEISQASDEISKDVDLPCEQAPTEETFDQPIADPLHTDLLAPQLEVEPQMVETQFSEVRHVQDFDFDCPMPEESPLVPERDYDQIDPEVINNNVQDADFGDNMHFDNHVNIEKENDFTTQEQVGLIKEDMFSHQEKDVSQEQFEEQLCLSPAQEVQESTEIMSEQPLAETTVCERLEAPKDVTPAPTPEPEIVKAESPIPVQPTEERVPSPTPVIEETQVQQIVAPIESEPEPIIQRELIVEATPDLVERPLANEMVTDLDEPLIESRAHEICVPVTDEIRQETPPPTPQADKVEEPLKELLIAAPNKETPLKATKAPNKSTPAKTTAKSTPLKATPPVKKATPITKSAPITKVETKPIAKTTTRPIAKAPIAAKTSTTSAARTTAAKQTIPSRTTSTTAAKPTTTTRAAPAKSSTVPARAPLTKPAAPTSAAPAKPKAPTTARVPITRAPLTKPIEKKPLTNGEVKPPPIRRATATAPKPSARPATAPAADKPTPAPRAPISRPTTTNRSIADKAKDAKTAPPRTAPIKAPLKPAVTKTSTTKTTTAKTAIKKVEKKPEQKKITNGTSQEVKPSDSLPDVIA